MHMNFATYLMRSDKFNLVYVQFISKCSSQELLQEAWLLPTVRASVSVINLRHNLATSGESRRYVIAFIRFAGGGIWLPQESLRHILASLGTPLGQSR